MNPPGMASNPDADTGVVDAGILDPTPVPLYSGVAQVGHTVTALPRDHPGVRSHLRTG